MTVTNVFSHITLHALHQDEPLSTEEAGFVLGQTFAALEYLHDHQWAHGNLDPRSILVMSRKRLWIKLTDTALSDYVDLGKPRGYHSMYASQHFVQADKSPADIWSAGVVALQLLLPKGLPHRDMYDYQQHKWVLTLERLAKDRDRKTGNDATAFVRSVLRHDVGDRPTATKILEDPWIVQNRGQDFAKNPHFNLPTPHGSRLPSAGPSNAAMRHGSVPPSNWSIHSDNASESRHTSVGPSRRPNKQGSAAPSTSNESGKYVQGSHQTNVGPSRHSRRHGSISSSNNAPDGFRHQKSYPTSRAPSKQRSRQSSTDPTFRAMLQSHPYPGDDYNDFDSEHGTTVSGSSRFTANPLAREPRTPTPYYSDDNSGMPGRFGSLRSQPRSSGSRSPAIVSEHGSTASRSSRYTPNPPSRMPHASTEYDSETNSSVAGPGSLPSQSRSGGVESFGRYLSQGEAEIEDDSGEETETDVRRTITPVAKKPRKAVPPLEMNLRSRGNGRR